MCPVGAVSMTTKRSSPCATVSAKARNTAISSVQGLRRSSSSSARPWASRPAPAAASTSAVYRRVSSAGSMRVTRSCEAPPLLNSSAAAATWAAGSVVVSVTGSPRYARAFAIRAATVVLPTPPLPMVITTPCRCFAISSMSASRCSPRKVLGESVGTVSSADAPGLPIFRRASMPTSPKASSGTSTRRSPRNPTGSASRAVRPRASIATAVASLASRAWNTPFKISWTLATPSCASSARVRSASTRNERSGRATSTSVVCAGSRSASFDAAYRALCALRPDSGPRHDVPPTLASMNVDHAAGSSSSRSVCPVGAVSKITWSNAAVATLSPSSFENSSKAAISTVQAPESCSSMLATATAGNTPRYGPTTRSR